MKVIFRESDHTYWLGDKQLISVTQLLKKHGLATNYTGVSEEVLEKAANKGTLIHKEIEDYIKTGAVGFTSELSDYIDITAELGFTAEDSEIILPAGEIPEDKAGEYFYAGTADLIGKIGDGYVLADLKTTAKVDKRAYAWQLALYERLCGVKFDNLYIFHLGKNSKAIPIERISDAEVDRLLECERNGEIYSEPGLIIANELLARAQEAELELKRAEETKKEAEATAKEYRQKLYEAMRQQNLSSFETADKTMLITCVAPSTQTKIDSAKLKKELPEIAEKYSKTSTVSGYVKITIREA